MEYLDPINRTVNPEHKTNFFLRLLFTYSKQILVKGFRQELTQDDIYEVLPAYKSQTLGNKLEKEWKKLVKSKNPSVFRLLWKCYGLEYLLILCSLIIPVVTGILQPKILKKFIFNFTKKEGSKDAYFDGISLILILFVQSVHYQNFFLRVNTLALKIRAGFTSLIYKQILKMPSGDISVGKTVTLITKDVNEFQSVFIISFLVQDVVVCCITLFVLYTEIGWLFLVLVFIIVLVLLPDTFLAFWVRSIKAKTLKKTEERCQQTKEVLSSIKLVKLYLWGEKLLTRICELRQKEVLLIKRIHMWLWAKYIFADVIFSVSWYCLLVISIYIGLQLNSGTLFLIMSNLHVLSRSVRLTLSVVLHKIATLIAVVNRLEEFLKRVPLCEAKQNLESVPKVSANLKLLNNLELNIAEGVTVITGPVGSGKSTLLKLLAREQDLEEGDLTVIGSISYASQEPWLFPSTVRQNILFGSKYDKERYLEVLRVCALIYDLECWPEGDATLVADKGVNLSKGQQVRINLARAVYKNCDIFLLDDCLASLDVVVSGFIFKECILKFLNGKIVILTSQHLRHVASANKVVTLGAKTEFVGPHTEATEAADQEEPENDDGDVDETTCFFLTNQRRLYEESKKIGKVPLRVYNSYVASGGYVLFFVVFFLGFSIVFLSGTVSKLQSKWITAEQIIFNNVTGGEYEDALLKRHQMTYLIPIVVLVVIVMDVLQITMYWSFAARASISIHKLLFEKVTNSTMQFFDTHLIGTVLNRFSEDLLYIDEVVPYTVLVFMRVFAGFVGTIVGIVTVNPFFVIPPVVSITILIFARMFYLKTGRALKRLEFSSRSPLIGAVNATMDGLTTVRISKQQSILREEFDRNLDVHISCAYTYLTTRETFLFLVYLCGICFFVFVIVLFLVLNKGSSVGDVGLVLIQTIMFIMHQQYLFRLWVEVENDMATVERTLEYTKQEQERKDGVLVQKWPHNGQITCQNLCFSYNTNRVLTNLNFSLESKEKVAVIGRTGSGKTSLVYSLLRLYNFKGKITIDGVDITTLPLDFFRLKISVNPQDPTLFTGSLRFNIDPTGQTSDDEIWTTVRTVGLSTFFQNLDERIGNDSKLSVGQKQLICLCRALIRRNKIVVMDELTANVDSKMETMIHEIIDEHFADSTVIMITHKLRFILKYDKVLILEKGQIVEYGDPVSLLQDENGLLHKIYKHNTLA